MRIVFPIPRLRLLNNTFIPMFASALLQRPHERYGTHYGENWSFHRSLISIEKAPESRSSELPARRINSRYLAPTIPIYLPGYKPDSAAHPSGFVRKCAYPQWHCHSFRQSEVTVPLPVRTIKTARMPPPIGILTVIMSIGRWGFGDRDHDGHFVNLALRGRLVLVFDAVR